jgi:AcrR family transcriptional regulator
MPRRSEEHLAMRREQILTAALRCFARQGFHATSMTDVIQESGTSAGSVYRYFPSKNALIKAGAERIFVAARDALGQVLAAPEPISPADALKHLLTRLMSVAQYDGIDLTRVGVVAWGEALRDPELLDEIRARYGGVRDDLIAVLERWRSAGHLPADTDVTLAGQVLFATMPGFLLQRHVFGDVEVDSYVAGLNHLTAGPSDRARPASGGSH